MFINACWSSSFGPYTYTYSKGFKYQASIIVYSVNGMGVFFLNSSVEVVQGNRERTMEMGDIMHELNFIKMIEIFSFGLSYF